MTPVSNFSYSVGLPYALLGIGAGILAGWWNTRGKPGTRLAVTIGGGALGFSGVYVVANVLLQVNDVGREFLIQEIASGRLALRVTTLTATYRFFPNAKLVARALPIEVPPYFDEEDLEEHAAAFKARQAEGGWRPHRVLMRNTVHASVFATLWALVILGHRSLEITGLNFLLAFIADDFLLMTSYRLQNDVVPPKWPRVQVAFMNTAMTLLLCVVLFQEFHFWVGVVGTVLISMVLGMPTLESALCSRSCREVTSNGM